MFIAETGHLLLHVNFGEVEPTVEEDNKDVMVLMMVMHNRLGVVFKKVDVVVNKLGRVVDVDVIREFKTWHQS